MTISEIFSAIAISGLVGTMFTMGLTLTLDNFKAIVRTPIGLSVGLFGQLILLPATAVALSLALGLSPAIAIGLLIIAACPGGATSNSFSYIAGGDLALSVALTAISSMVAFITIPLVIGFGLEILDPRQTRIELPLASTSLQVFTTTALPVMAGMVFRKFQPEIAAKITSPIFWISFAAIIVPFAALIMGLQSGIGDLTLSAMSGALLSVLMLLLGYAIAWLARLGREQQIAVTLEVGMQNFGLVVVIVPQILKEPFYLAPGVSYLASALLCGATLAFLLRRFGPGTQIAGLANQ
ncbi:MAG: hypothetical protein AAF753_02275 [Pseudomonadota bacterium]